MSFFEKAKADGLASAINMEFDNLKPEIKSILTGLSNLAPTLTTAATVAEGVTGNAALIPLTQAAGTAAANLGNVVQIAQPTASAAANILSTVKPVLVAAGVPQAVIDHVNEVSLALDSGTPTVSTTATPATPATSATPVQ